MRKAILSLLTVLFAVSGTQAAIIGWECEDDKDGAVTMGTMAWSYDAGADEYSLRVPEVQHWGPAHLEGAFFTDTPEDPVVWILKDVENQTGYEWDGYTMNVFMMQSFDITGSMAPVNWNSVVTPVAAGPFLDSHGNSWNYKGTVQYAPLSPADNIGIGETGSYGVRVAFLGTVSFEVEQIPLPEPSTLALLLSGALFLRRSRR